MKEESSEPGMVYRLKVTLKGSRPPIWRRLEVPGDITLAKLHKILQIAMGWTDTHLHSFKIGETHYEEPDPDIDPEFSPYDKKNEKKFKLQEVAGREKMKFLYEYDFGDGWEHEILVEKILPMTDETRHPVCLKGAKACPPEDIGGIWGYYKFLEIMQNPEHPEHENMMEWVGGHFDPDEFDLDEINKLLKKIK
ncbi:MAG: plasmid pRiA4b ORF-3 family protein [Deltaproteobacteria bacterium]|nr:plasmid pRiA4b ORF-3 family protein [Deltaproteobacteria bacterium]